MGTDRVLSDAGDRHCDVGVGRSCTGGDRAALCWAGGLRQYGDRVGSACCNLGRKWGGAGTGGRNRQVIRAVVLQYHRAGEPDHRALIVY